jgi:hypothetical protein
MILSFFFIIILLFYAIFENLSNGTPIEDHLETEIDPREPTSFVAGQTKTLSVRLNGFRSIIHYLPDGRQEAFNVNNWELFAIR